MTDPKPEKPIRSSTDRIGFYCSSLLLSVLFVFLMFDLDGVLSNEHGEIEVSFILMLAGPYVILFRSFVCWAILYLNNCRPKYHLTWIFSVFVCLVAIFSFAQLQGKI